MNVIAKQQELVNFIWSIANLLRGTYRPPQYRRVMIPMIVLRRLDCVLEDSKAGIVEEFQALQARKYEAATVETIIKQKFKVPFFNTSKYTFRSLLGDPNQLAVNFGHYLKSFSAEARAILEHFEFEKEIEKLDKANLLFKVVQAFTSADIDLHPSRVPNHQMGYVFEELVRKFNEQANEEAGDHFTPREVIRLMVHVLFQPDDAMLTKRGIIRTLYDPCCGTGGMLTLAEEYVEHFTGGARLKVYGQEYNDESFAICGSDIMIKSAEADTSHIVFGDTLGDGKTRDGFPDAKFHYMLANPPFGVEWKKEADIVEAEHNNLGFAGRFGPGLPRINDGSLLFLLHMMSKMKPAGNEKGQEKGQESDGCRIGIVFNGSPLFTGDAGSGESEIRRWIIENDYLEAIIALPDQMFYNTGIYTYVWIVTNRKLPHRQGKVQLINASGLSEKMKKSLGNKRNLMTDAQIDQVVNLYAHFSAEGEAAEHVRIFNNQDFAFIKLTVERPLRLNFALSDERIQRATECSAYQSLIESKKRKDTAGIEADRQAGQALQAAIVKVLGALQAKHSAKLWKDRAEFAKLFDAAFKKADCKLPTPLRKALISALGERDETANICREKDAQGGAPEADPELRDTENVPYVPFLPQVSEGGAAFPLPVPVKYGANPDLSELLAIVQPHCQDYIRREVLPHVSDAWVDWSKTKIGFEIPFNRHFYQYTPPRPLADIAADIRALEADIVKLLGEVAV